MQEVIDLTLQGKRPGEVAKALNIKVREVESILQTWRDVATDDRALKDRARTVLAGADEHYSKLIQGYYEIINEVDAQGATTAQMLAQKAGAIKGIADLEAKRFTMLKDMGLTSDAETASYQAELERKIEIVEGVLREVVSDCPRCRIKVHERLAEISGKTLPVQVIREGSNG